MTLLQRIAALIAAIGTDIKTQQAKNDELEALNWFN
jgi:hypothetical protein